MRKPYSFALLPAAALAFVWACSTSDTGSNPPGGDASADPYESGVDTSLIDDGPPPADVVTNNCQLNDLSDPVALCLQQLVLGSEVQYAYVKGVGVAPTWSSDAPYAAGPGHDWQDDVGLAGALGGYQCSSAIYGNNLVTPAFDAILADLGPVITAELTQAPDDYDGETYFRLRWAQAAFYFISDSADGDKLKALAEAYGATLQTKFVQTVAASGGDGGTGDGGAGDAGLDAGGGSAGGVVIGVASGNGTVAYEPAKAAMAAAALLDMAFLHKGGDAGALVHQWQTTGMAVLDYLASRAVDPTTGLFYQSLVASGDPGHDALGSGTPTPDTLLTETQATLMLALTRAQERVNQLPALGASDAGDSAVAPVSKYATMAAVLAHALAATPLWDGPTSGPVDGGAAMASAYMEGLIPSAAGVGPALLTDRTTVGNAYFLGGLHRLAVTQGSDVSYQAGLVRTGLTQLQPAHTSLLSVVIDPTSSFPIQQSYLRATSQGWDFAQSFGPEGGVTGQEPGAKSYRSAAVHAMAEGFNQLWQGRPSPPDCGP